MSTTFQVDLNLHGVVVNMTEGSYRITEVAERAGFSTPTLRYYEDIRLLRPAERNAAGYRLTTTAPSNGSR